MLLKKWGLLAVMVVLCLCFITRSPVTAQGTAHVRFAHFIYKGPQVNILADDKAITDESKLPYVLNTFELSKFYVDLSADTPHTFTVVPVGKTPDAALFKAQSFTLTDAHNYTLVLIGNVDGKDLQFSLVDETLALAPYDLKASAVTIVFDNVEGMPALDLYWAGKPIVTNIVYGQYIIVQDQPEGKGSKFTPHGDPKTVLFEYADAIGGPAQTIAFFGLAGKYPGTLGQDYDTPYVGSYIGTPITRDSGSIAVGDVVKVSMAELGVRYDYKLVLDKDMTLDIIVAGVGVNAASTDAYLRIFDASGKLIVQNDELVDRTAVHDAGVKGLKLAKGTYTIEAASAFDTNLGDYTLSVQASK